MLASTPRRTFTSGYCVRRAAISAQLGIAHAVGDVAGTVVGDGDLPQALFVGGADIVGDGAGTVGIGGVGVVIVEHSILCGQIVHGGSSCR